jgi:hypothetical protein
VPAKQFRECDNVPVIVKRVLSRQKRPEPVAWNAELGGRSVGQTLFLRQIVTGSGSLSL